nr:hypothetical protein BdHM001_04520 [Bdellovibrio sp. HM001]
MMKSPFQTIRNSLLATTLCLVLGQSFAWASVTVKTEKFDNGVTSKESYYQDTVLTERRYFDIEGRFTGWMRFTKSTQGLVIVTELSVEKENYGQIKSQEEWSLLDQEGHQTDKSRLMRKWHYTKEAPVTLEYIGHHEQNEPFREIRKDYLNKENQITSSIFLYYKGQDEKPYAFIEKNPQGKVLSQFSLYEKYDLVGSLKKAGLTADEIAVLKKQQKNPNRFLVAIIDSGFDYNHKELVSKWWNNPQDPVDGIDNDGNGWIDDNFGWEQVRNIGLPTESSIGMHKDHRPLSHGTHVAHIASRGLNNIALVGFAGDYTRADYIRKMSAFIKKHQVRIVNMSLGFPADNKDLLGLRDGIRAYKTMIEENPNTLFVVASGNAGVDLDMTKNRQYPASFTHPNVLKVGALTASTIEEVTPENAKMADFSNFGKENVDILAPGVKVNAASLGGGLIEHSGTSMATPYMVNLIARLWSELPELSASEVRDLFISTAQVTKDPAPVKSGGYADLKKALLTGKMKLLKDRYAKVDGPNCWNASTYLAGVSKGLHHTFASEFANIVDSALCQPVPLEQAQAGDTIAFRRLNRHGKVLPAAFASEVHGYTLIGPGLGFTKNGVSAAAPYQEQPSQEIFYKYRSQEGRECKKLGIERQDCRLAQMAYRCRGLEEFMSQHGGLNVFEKDLLLEVSRLEKIVQSQMLDQKNLNVNIEPVLERLKNKVLELKARGSSLIVTDYFESRLESLEYR